MSPRLKSVLLLFSASFIWGLSFPMNRLAVPHMNPWAYSALRYMFGALALLPMALRWGRRPAPASYFAKYSPWTWLWGGFLAGCLLCAGTGLQYFGLLTTTASKSGFITALYVSMVPLFGFVLGQVPSRLVWIALVMGLSGVILLSAPGSSGGFSRGDALTLASDLFWASHVLVMAHFALRANPWRVVWAQSMSCGLLCLGMAAYSGALPTMGQFRAVWPYALWGVMSVSVAYVFQVMAQKSTPAASAALIMQFQSVIAAICGVLFLGESMTGLMAFGAFLMVAGSLVAQRAPDPVRILPEHRFFKKLMAARVALAIAILAICVAAVALTG